MSYLFQLKAIAADRKNQKEEIRRSTKLTKDQPKYNNKPKQNYNAVGLKEASALINHLMENLMDAIGA